MSNGRLSRETIRELSESVVAMKKLTRDMLRTEPLSVRYESAKMLAVMSDSADTHEKALECALAVAATHPEMVIALLTTAYCDSVIEGNNSEFAARQ